MDKRCLVLLVALLLAACAPANPSPAPSSTVAPLPSPAPSSTPAPLPSPSSTPNAAFVVNSVADLRRIINEIASAPPGPAEAEADAFYRALVDSRRVPLILGEQVAFIYKGAADSVTWRGTFTGWSEGPGLVGGRIGQTDLWIAQAEMPPASRAEYKIVLNGKDWILDPANPVVVPSGASDNNLFSLPGFQVTDESARRSGVAQGTLSSVRTIDSKNLSYAVNYWVYTPAGYDKLNNLPVLYFTDGNDWSDERAGAAPIVLDNLIAEGRIKPVIAVFVDEREPGKPENNRRESEFLIHPEQYAGFIAEELVPAVDAAYHTDRTAGGRLIVGVSFGGVIASFIAARYSDVFNNLAAFSPSMWVFLAPERLETAKADGVRRMSPVIDSLTQCGGDKVKCRTQPLKVFASNGFPSWDVGDLSPIAANLQKQGYTIRYIQVQEGHAWTAWRGLADEMLTFMESASK